MLSIKVFLTLWVFALSVTAFWRMECRGAAAFARLDPIVNFGKESGHLHAIHGSSGFSATSGYDELMAGDCTSCAVKQDKSAYWHPPAYYHDKATGAYELVNEVGGMLAYYFLYSGYQQEPIVAFPPGFRMIAGDSTRRNYTIADTKVTEPDPEKSFWAELNQTTQKDLEQRAIGFNCLNYNKKPNEGSLYRHFLPDKNYIDQNCIDGVRFELSFPSCWNGKDLDSPNHRDHVAYPDLVINGNCPEGFPVRLPGIFYEVIWDTPAFKGRDGEFVIANGDPEGFGYHGDFMTGWDPNFLQQAINTCTNDSGKIEDCHIFDISSQDEQNQCHIPLPANLAAENVKGPLAQLPGNNPLRWGPEPAIPGKDADPAQPVNTVRPTLTYSPGKTASKSGSVGPGDIFEHTSKMLSSPAPAVANPTPAKSYTPVSTQRITGTAAVSEVVYEEEVVWVTMHAAATTTVQANKTPSPAPGRAEKHAPQHVGRRRHNGRAIRPF